MVDILVFYIRGWYLTVYISVQCKYICITYIIGHSIRLSTYLNLFPVANLLLKLYALAIQCMQPSKLMSKHYIKILVFDVYHMYVFVSILILYKLLFSVYNLHLLNVYIIKLYFIIYVFHIWKNSLYMKFHFK